MNRPLAAAARQTGQAVLALYRLVTEEIAQIAGLDEPAAATLARRAGNRATLLLALLEVAGFRAELVLARPRQLSTHAPSALDLEDRGLPRGRDRACLRP